MIIEANREGFDDVVKRFNAASSVPDRAPMTTKKAADFLTSIGLPVSAATLNRWRCVRSDGPRYQKVAGRIFYRAGDLRAFVENQ